jgi:four helix bundle protein
MKENILKEKSFGFAIRIIDLCKFLKTEQLEYVLSKQILRSGTAIGANIREAEFAESTRDFFTN